ncbi:MAG: DNA repair and recombination protein RadB [Haloferacaceae archaeon]
MTDPLPTGCEPIDDLLGGGFERGVVTQVYGPTAAGKTNLALAAAVRVAAAGDRALYVDTEGLSGERFRQLARGALDDPDEGRIEDLASRVVVSEAHDFAEQEEAVRDAADLAPQAELVVLDSATGFYRLERSADDDGETLRRVGRQVTHLLSLARKHDLAAVLTNQVFTDPDADRVRALGGHTLDHWTGVVVRLDRFRGGNRRATLEKHHARPAGETVAFRIAERGMVGTERTT